MFPISSQSRRTLQVGPQIDVQHVCTPHLIHVHAQGHFNRGVEAISSFSTNPTKSVRRFNTPWLHLGYSSLPQSTQAGRDGRWIFQAITSFDMSFRGQASMLMNFEHFPPHPIML